MGVRGRRKRLEASGLDWTTNDGRSLSGPTGSSAGTTLPATGKTLKTEPPPMHAARLSHSTTARSRRGLIPIGFRIAAARPRTLSR